jgi:demethylmenaquinone methyltransferase/2-methoxy-6-polyprenyl-1,4-benzoquinol methylase
VNPPSADPPSALPGTRPEGTGDDSEAAARVREMFSRIAPRYDLLNHLLSFSFDRVWRRRTAKRFRHILVREDARVLDLCCGTGDLSLALTRMGSAFVWGSDFAHPMLVRAQEKTGASGWPRYLEADALSMPFPNASFDLVTAAFGFRNLANYERGLLEILRLLKPGGEVGILEFAAPQGSVFGSLYRFYFKQVLPRVGGAVSGDRATYAYLPSSVGRFPSPEELRTQMEQAGFVDARCELWTGGIVALHTARKP